MEEQKVRASPQAASQESPDKVPLPPTFSRAYFSPSGNGDFFLMHLRSLAGSAVPVTCPPLALLPVTRSIPQCIKLNARAAGVGAGGASGEKWVGLRTSGRGTSGGGAAQWLLGRNPCSQKKHFGGECHKVCILP